MFFISCTITSEEEPASRFTASITSSQTAHPALNTSTLRLLAISLSFDAGKRRMHLGVYSKVKDGFSPHFFACCVSCGSVLDVFHRGTPRPPVGTGGLPSGD